MIKAQKLIDDLSAQDIINLDRADLQELEARRKAEIKTGSR